MKQFFIAMMLLLLCAGLSAEWLDVEFAFQLGWIPQGFVAFYQPEDIAIFEPYDIVFKIDATAFDFIKIGGSCTSVFSSSEFKLDFMPTGITYLFYCGIEPFKNLSINFEHSCSHPIAAYQNREKGISILDSGYSRVYLELKVKADF